MESLRSAEWGQAYSHLGPQEGPPLQVLVPITAWGPYGLRNPQEAGICFGPEPFQKVWAFSFFPPEAGSISVTRKPVILQPPWPFLLLLLLLQPFSLSSTFRHAEVLYFHRRCRLPRYIKSHLQGRQCRVPPWVVLELVNWEQHAEHWLPP